MVIGGLGKDFLDDNIEGADYLVTGARPVVNAGANFLERLITGNVSDKGPQSDTPVRDFFYPPEKLEDINVTAKRKLYEQHPKGTYRPVADDQSQDDKNIGGLDVTGGGASPMGMSPLEQQLSDVSSSRMETDPEALRTSARTRYSEDSEAMGIKDLAKDLANSRMAASAYNDKITNPRDLAWQRFIRGASQADQGSGAFGNFTQGSQAELSRQQAAQRAFFASDQSLIEKQLDGARTGLTGITDAGTKAFETGQATRTAGMQGASNVLSTQAQREANMLTKQTQLILAETNRISANTNDIDQLTQAERMAAVALAEAAEKTDKAFDTYLYATGNATLSTQKDPESMQQMKDLRGEWDVNPAGGAAFMQSVKSLQTQLNELRQRMIARNPSGSGGSGGFALDSVREE